MASAAACSAAAAKVIKLRISDSVEKVEVGSKLVDDAVLDQQIALQRHPSQFLLQSADFSLRAIDKLVGQGAVDLGVRFTQSLTSSGRSLVFAPLRQCSGRVV
jgi:hypothetical protein